MAIKQKLPSPQEIKSTPQAFNKQEINDIKELRNKINNLSFQFGQLYIRKIELEKEEISLKKELESLEKEEINIAKKLTNKYGKGSIDLKTGTFTPLQ